MAKPAFYQVAESFVGNLDGAELEYQKGEVVDGEDAALKKWPGHFKPLVLRGHDRGPAVEQATAAPGEQRGHAMTTDDIRPAKRG